ncbi:MAG: hypothetical protein AAF490_26405 [Chloroflexota bacterium]
MFDWQTEEDEIVWEDEVQTPQEEPSGQRFKWWVVFLPLILIGGGYYVYLQIQEQTDTAVSAVEDDIVSSHTLLIDAVENEDRDLFELLLSGRDMVWVRTYDDLVRENLFLDYAPFGLTYQPDSYELIDIELTPALDSAEVDFSLAYLDEAGQTIRLKQTAVFRPGETRWLFAPPETDFWGEWQTLELEGLALIYNEQDAEWVEGFAPEIEQFLPALCQSLDEGNCDNWGKIIRFDNRPERKLEYDRLESRYNSGQQINLPGPSLIGFPTDADSSRFLSETYKEMIARIYLADLLGYECCQQIVLFDTLITYQLSELEFGSWPVTNEMHTARFQDEDNTPSLLNFQEYWGSEAASSLAADEQADLELMVDFVTQLNPDLTAVDLIESLLAAEFTVGRWLNFLVYGESVNELRNQSSLSELDTLWRQYAFLHENAQTDLPPSISEETLTIVCAPRNLTVDSTQIHQYQFAAQSWQTIKTVDDFAMLHPFPDNSRAVSQTLIFNEFEPPRSIIEIWDGDRQQIIKSLEEEYAISLGQISQNGRFLSAYIFVNDERAQSATPDTLVFDLMNCTADGCDVFGSNGFPIWSPNEQNVLFLPFDNFDFFTQLGDGRVWHSGDKSPFNIRLGMDIIPPAFDGGYATYTSEIVDFGYSPVWLTDNAFGFVETNVERTESFFHMFSVDNLERRVTLFSADDIQQVIPNSESRNPQLSYVMPMPHDDTQLLVVTSGRGSTGHLVMYDMLTESASYITQVTTGFQHLLAVSPNGRFIAVSSDTTDDFQSREVAIVNLETGEIQEAFLKGNSFFIGLAMDWSADSEWLAIATDLDILQLFHLPTNQKYLLSHPHGNCDSISWLDQLSP